MDVIFVWLIAGVAGLMLVAAGVAAWEHLRRSVRPQAEFSSATPRAVRIDLRLDRLSAARPAPAPQTPASPAGGSDLVQRRAALDDALARMVQHAAAGADSPQHWADTTPMVAAGHLSGAGASPDAGPRKSSTPQQP